MTFTERYTWAGLILSIATFAAYWIVVVIRAASDVLPFAEVAWQGPMLWALILGGGLYALAMLVLWIRVRGEAHTDARDHEIERYAATAGSGLTGGRGAGDACHAGPGRAAFLDCHGAVRRILPRLRREHGRHAVRLPQGVLVGGSKPTRVTNCIRDLRTELGLTQAGLAATLGVSRQTVIAIEQGRYSPSLEMAFQIAQSLRVPLDEVFSYQGDDAS